jgi:hypothetical protein
MTGRVVSGIVLIAVALGVRGHAAGHPDLSGVWMLNRDASEFPKEVGFDPDWVDGGPSGSTVQGGTTTRSSGARGGRGGGGGTSIRLPAVAGHYQSEEDVRKLKEVLNEVKAPPMQLTITESDSAVTIADSAGRHRVVHPGAKQDVIQLEAGPMVAVTKWDGAAMFVSYRVDVGQELRCWYSRDATSGRLIVRMQLAERNRGQVLTRAYDAAPVPTR